MTLTFVCEISLFKLIFQVIIIDYLLYIYIIYIILNNLILRFYHAVMDNSEKVDMLLIYGECLRNPRAAAALYAQRYENRYHPCANSFRYLEKQLRNTGQMNNNKKRRREKTVRNEENNINVIANVEAYPHSSIKCIAANVGISSSSVQRILKTHKYHPYKVNLVQNLRPGDDERRLEFVAWLSATYYYDFAILQKILWTDESRFTNNGIMNRHNYNFWSDSNPNEMRERNFQYKWGINVWCGIVGSHLVGPYFYQENLTADRYLNFLTNELYGLLEDVPLQIRQNLVFQQDGAPAHNGRIIRTFLNLHFPGRWIGINGPIAWPPRSPDLTVLDFFLWGTLKEMVYKEPSENLEELQMKITNACRSISPEVILAASGRELLSRADLCQQEEGAHFEHMR